MKKVTLKDIAAKAGVSIALVSNYLNHHPSARMSEQTRKKIDHALRELDYHCSDIARSLRTGRSRIIGYFSENLRNEVTQNEMLEFFAAAAKEDYRVFVGFSSCRGETLESIRSLQARGCDALVISGFFDQQYCELLMEIPVPVVILNTNCSAAVPGTVLRYDYKSAIRDGIGYLRAHGHDGIYYQTRSCEPWDQRYQEFSDTFPEDHVWLLQKKNAQPEDWRAFLKKHPDCSALFHLNDFLAMDSIRICSQLGLSVPGDISIIGFDNIRVAEHTLPSLSTISRPLSEAAEHAVASLLARLNGKKSELPEVLSCRFIPRESIR